MNLILILLGIVIGMIMISLGGGGGALYIGILTSVAGLTAGTAASTSLYVSLPALAVGTYLYYSKGLISFKIGNRMLLATIPTVIVGSIVARFIPKPLYTWGIAIVLITMGIRIFFVKTGHSESENASTWRAVFYGSISGLMVGIGGISGGGPVMAGLLIMGMELSDAAATSAYVLLCSTVAGLFFHLHSATINWTQGTVLMIGSLLGAIVAPLMINKLNTKKLTTVLKPVMAVLLIIMGVNMMI